MQRDGASSGSDRILFGGYRLTHKEMLLEQPEGPETLPNTSCSSDPERNRDLRIELAEAHYRLDNKRIQVVLLSTALIGATTFSLAKQARRWATKLR